MADQKRRRPMGVLDTAEAVFKKPTTTATPLPAAAPPVPGARESVTLRIDQDVLAYFQEQGPGWQDRLNAALRHAVGL